MLNGGHKMSPLATVLVLAALVVLVIWYAGAKAVAPPVRAAVGTPTVEPPSLVIGKQRHLANPSSEYVSMAATNQQLAANVQSVAFNTSDVHGIMLGTGTSVLVLDTDTAYGQPTRKIRVLNGPFKDETGWVLATDLAP